MFMFCVNKRVFHFILNNITQINWICVYLNLFFTTFICVEIDFDLRRMTLDLFFGVSLINNDRIIWNTSTIQYCWDKGNQQQLRAIVLYHYHSINVIMCSIKSQRKSPFFWYGYQVILARCGKMLCCVCVWSFSS